MSAITLVPADPDAHLELVHGWMQQPHVVPWWELAGPREPVRAYLAGQRALPHLDPWIALADETPFAYVETYRAAEDPLAGHYEALPGDRGWHVLVGPPEFLGSGVPRELAREVIVRLMREPGAQRVVCEPDERNARMVAFCRALGGEVVASLDLPDKRAALVVWTRADVAARWPEALVP